MGQEFLLVHTRHHKLVQLYLSISRTVSHCNQIVNFFLVKVAAVVLPIAIQDFIATQRAVSRLVQILEDHLQLDRVLHVHKVLDQVAKRGLLCSIFCAEITQICQSTRHIQLT